MNKEYLSKFIGYQTYYDCGVDHIVLIGRHWWNSNITLKYPYVPCGDNRRTRSESYKGALGIIKDHFGGEV